LHREESRRRRDHPKVTTGFADITTKAREVNTLVIQITAATKEQSTGLSQVSQAVCDLDKVTQKNAVLSEETSASAAELTNHAARLDDTASRSSESSSGRKNARMRKSAPAAEVAASARAHRQKSVIRPGPIADTRAAGRRNDRVGPQLACGLRHRWFRGAAASRFARRWRPDDPVRAFSCAPQSIRSARSHGHGTLP